MSRHAKSAAFGRPVRGECCENQMPVRLNSRSSTSYVRELVRRRGEKVEHCTVVPRSDAMIELDRSCVGDDVVDASKIGELICQQCDRLRRDVDGGYREAVSGEDSHERSYASADHRDPAAAWGHAPNERRTRLRHGLMPARILGIRRRPQCVPVVTGGSHLGKLRSPGGRRCLTAAKLFALSTQCRRGCESFAAVKQRRPPGERSFPR